jgi:hypothetical protein
MSLLQSRSAQFARIDPEARKDPSNIALHLRQICRFCHKPGLLPASTIKLSTSNFRTWQKQSGFSSNHAVGCFLHPCVHTHPCACVLRLKIVIVHEPAHLVSPYLLISTGRTHNLRHPSLSQIGHHPPRIRKYCAHSSGVCLAYFFASSTSR